MATATAAPPAADAGPEKKSKKKLIIIVVALVVVAAAAYFLVLKPKPAANGEKPKPVAGVVTPLEPIQINLEGGHYLRIGIALQQTDKAAEALDGSKALDATINLFSGLSITELSSAKERTKLKEELTTELEHLYEDEVMGVYFTEFVMQ